MFEGETPLIVDASIAASKTVFFIAAMTVASLHPEGNVKV